MKGAGWRNGERKGKERKGREGKGREGRYTPKADLFQWEGYIFTSLLLGEDFIQEKSLSWAFLYPVLEMAFGGAGGLDWKWVGMEGWRDGRGRDLNWAVFLSVLSIYPSDVCILSCFVTIEEPCYSIAFLYCCSL